MSKSSALSSGLLAAGTTTVVSRKSLLNGVVAISDGTNTATVTVYDNASTATGTVLAKAVATSAAPTSSNFTTNHVRADNGITVVVAGTGSGAIIYFDA